MPSCNIHQWVLQLCFPSYLSMIDVCGAWFVCLQTTKAHLTVLDPESYLAVAHGQ